MDLELRDIITDKPMLDSIEKTDQMVKENIFGQMEIIIKGNLLII